MTNGKPSTLHDPASSPLVRLVDPAGRDGPTTPREIADNLQAGGFFWLDLENPSDQELAEFRESLRLPAGTIESAMDAAARSSFAPVADSIRAVLPTPADTRPGEWLQANYVTVVLTKQFLFTVHVASCTPLQHARRHYHALDKGARTDRARVLFLVLDVLIGSFRSQLLALDDRLGEIQLAIFHGGSPGVHNELIQILGDITDGIQELGWYSNDLAEIAETLDELPGMRPGAQQLHDGHRQRVRRMIQNGRDIREEAKDALGHYSEVISGRQAQVINALTIVATVFLPLSFLTGYFGMNFATLTGHIENKLWEYIVFGLVLFIASAALSLLLIHRLERRLGIRHYIGGRQS